MGGKLHGGVCPTEPGIGSALNIIEVVSSHHAASSTLAARVAAHTKTVWTRPPMSSSAGLHLQLFLAFPCRNSKKQNALYGPVPHTLDVRAWMTRSAFMLTPLRKPPTDLLTRSRKTAMTFR